MPAPKPDSCWLGRHSAAIQSDEQQRWVRLRGRIRISRWRAAHEAKTPERRDQLLQRVEALEAELAALQPIIRSQGRNVITWPFFEWPGPPPPIPGDWTPPPETTAPGWTPPRW